MAARRQSNRRIGRAAGIAWLILGLAPAPWPLPDYHNVRHHDAPGEVCEHHDHLLRWHPGAGVASDVAVLHWHWFLPATPDAEPPDEHAAPAMHANAPGCLATTWDDGPSLVALDASRPLELLTPSAFDPGSSFGPASDRVALPALEPNPPPSPGAAIAPAGPLNARLQRWVC
jgi:hypothetical protein